MAAAAANSPHGQPTMRFESTAKVLAGCKLKYYRISERGRTPDKPCLEQEKSFVCDLIALQA